MQIVWIGKEKGRRWLVRLGLLFVWPAIWLLTLEAPALPAVDWAALQGRTIAIDPGHGGIDGGASAHAAVEKELTLAIAQRLVAVLEAHGAKVVLTRVDDSDYYTRGKGGKRNDLLTRVSYLNQSGADVFVSIHCNAIRGAKNKGAQVFYNPRQPQNQALAQSVQDRLRDFPPGNKRKIQQDLQILLLNECSIPGVLIETGYITNPEEARLLQDSAYQQNLAEQIAAGLAYHLQQNAGR